MPTTSPRKSGLIWHLSGRGGVILFQLIALPCVYTEGSSRDAINILSKFNMWMRPKHRPDYKVIEDVVLIATTTFNVGSGGNWDKVDELHVVTAEMQSARA